MTEDVDQREEQYDYHIEVRLGDSTVIIKTTDRDFAEKVYFGG